MARDYLRFLILAELCGFYTFSATAAVSIFSDYGQIQNVQNYSTNPFWSPNSPYNQRLPQPVYVQGADLKAADCISVVKSMVSAQCMTRDNCKNTVLSDIRPTIMVQLANLPGANYVSACSGYLDYIFDTYKQQNANTLSNRKISFPAETTPNPDINNTNGVQLKNPYKSQPAKWLQDIKGRADELRELQKQNGSDDYTLSAKTFPKTYEDLSFTERIENDRAGLMPYKDAKAYYTLDIMNIVEYCEDSDNKKTEACIKYRDCTEIAKKNDDNVTRAEYADNHIDCIVKECKTGFIPKNPERKVCMNEPGKDCTAEMQKTDDKVKYAEIDANGKCIIMECDTGFEPNGTKTECVCKKPDHAVEVEEIDGICKVTECEDGYHIDSTGTGCEQDVSSGNNNNNNNPPVTSAPPVTPDPSTSTDGTPCTPSDPRAIEGVWRNNECIITKCKRLFEPATDSKSCVRTYPYYQLAIITTGLHGKVGVKYSVNAGDNCYCTTKEFDDGSSDDVNDYVLTVIPNAPRYCAPDINGTKISQFILKDKNGNEIAFTEEEYDKILGRLSTRKNQSKCNGDSTVEVHFFKVYINPNDSQAYRTEIGQFDLDD